MQRWWTSQPFALIQEGISLRGIEDQDTTLKLNGRFSSFQYMESGGASHHSAQNVQDLATEFRTTTRLSIH
jgi:hypothetical protein